MSGETEIRPFQVDLPDEALADLRRRIDATRWPTRELVADRAQGVQLAAIRELARYWTAGYDWRAFETGLNALPQFKTEIDGEDIHFIHVKSPHDCALPLIISHGWPGSFIEMLGVIGPLTDPTAHGGSAEDAFDLKIPSLPGYGFTSEPTETGWNVGRIAAAWAELMRRLGYTRYVAQGGDVGAAVTDAMGRQAPDGLLGIHMNLLLAGLGGGYPSPNPAREEQEALDAIATFLTSGRAYLIEQNTRPQTIPGPRPGQRHDVLADRHRGLSGPVVLGELPSRHGGGRETPPGRQAPGRLHHLPRRDLPRPAQLGREVLPERHLLPRGRPGWPLRRLGRARTVRDGDPGRVPATALTTVRTRDAPGRRLAAGE